MQIDGIVQSERCREKCIKFVKEGHRNADNKQSKKDTERNAENLLYAKDTERNEDD
jgi:hypothetical protein